MSKAFEEWKAKEWKQYRAEIENIESAWNAALLHAANFIEKDGEIYKAGSWEQQALFLCGSKLRQEANNENTI